jgi:hypothetical protein
MSILAKIFFNHPRRILDEGQLTVELGKKDAKMSGSITCMHMSCCIHVALFLSHIAAESKVVRGKKKEITRDRLQTMYY